MKRALTSSFFTFLITALLCGPVHVFSSNKAGNSFKHQKSNSAFIENKGQILDQNNNPNPSVLYLLNTPGLNVQLRKGGFSYDIYQVHCQQSAVSSQDPASDLKHSASSIEYHRIDID